MNINKFDGDLIEVSLRQLGASEIIEVNGILYTIKFKLDEQLEVSYSYNINSKNEFCLQRVTPYPISHGTFGSEGAVIEFITKDIHKFRNAQKSSNFNRFIEVTQKVNRITDRMEELFLNYNVNGEDLAEFDKELADVVGSIDKIEKSSIEL